MLVLSRKNRERIIITVPPSDKPQQIEIVVTEISPHKVRIGTVAQPGVKIWREEIFDRINETSQDVPPVQETLLGVRQGGNHEEARPA